MGKVRIQEKEVDEKIIKTSCLLNDVNLKSILKFFTIGRFAF